MSRKRTKSSVLVVLDKKDRVVCYLSKRDEEQGKDILYDLQGYKVIAI